MPVPTLKYGDDGWPESASLCDQCNERAVINLEGLAYCLNCGDLEEITPAHELPDREGY